MPRKRRVSILDRTRVKENARNLALLALGCVVLLVATATQSAADNGPHTMGAGATPDTCALCHRLHTAQSPYLLKQSEEALCYTCHGTAAAGASTDVKDGVGYANALRGGKPLPLRGGGFKYALIDSAHPSGQQSGGSDPAGVVPVTAEGAAATSAHSVDSSGQTAWGNGPISAEVDYGKMVSLSCGSCHDPHGNGNYRVLRPIPLESGASGVYVSDATAKVYTTENYWDVQDQYAPGFLEDISGWCATCHTRYLSGTSYTESGDAVFTDRHISDQKTQGSANCIQCHVAHGSNASVEEAPSLAVHSPNAVPAGSDSRLLRVDDKGTCRMCHAE
jgi:predicted CXXCH cytochrome family protein